MEGNTTFTLKREVFVTTLAYQHSPAVKETQVDQTKDKCSNNNKHEKRLRWLTPVIARMLIKKNVPMYEKKEPTDDTSKDVYSLLAQHVSGIIMTIVRRQTE